MKVIYLYLSLIHISEPTRPLYISYAVFCLKKKKKKRKKEKRVSHIIKCLLTELGRARRENIWHSVMAHRPRYARSIRHDLRPNIFPSGPPTQSISTYYKPCYHRQYSKQHFLTKVRPIGVINMNTQE